MTRDPIKDGRNWYSYCGDNPVSFFDANGTVALAIAPLALASPPGWVALNILGIAEFILFAAAISHHVYYADSDSGRVQSIVSAEVFDSEMAHLLEVMMARKVVVAQEVVPAVVYGGTEKCLARMLVGLVGVSTVKKVDTRILNILAFLKGQI